MRLWVEDFTSDLAGALRATGVGLAAVAWASVLGSEFQASADVRTTSQVAAAIVGVAVAQWFSRLPPSASPADIVRPMEKDILAVAREQAHGDTEQMEFLTARITMLAVVRLRRGGNVPGDRRAWLRTLGRLASEG